VTAAWQEEEDDVRKPLFGGGRGHTAESICGVPGGRVPGEDAAATMTRRREMASRILAAAVAGVCGEGAGGSAPAGCRAC
jgi:hypothetical protein